MGRTSCPSKARGRPRRGDRSPGRVREAQTAGTGAGSGAATWEVRSGCGVAPAGGRAPRGRIWWSAWKRQCCGKGTGQANWAFGEEPAGATAGDGTGSSAIRALHNGRDPGDATAPCSRRSTVAALRCGRRGPSVMGAELSASGRLGTGGSSVRCSLGFVCAIGAAGARAGVFKSRCRLRAGAGST
jgi:hypothetical protein